MRRSSFLGIALAICLLTAGATNLDARVIVHWSVQDLFDKSDLVAMATPICTGDAQEQADLPGIKQLKPDNKIIGIPAIGVETTFRIAGVLKGDKSLQKFTLHH